MLCGLVNGSVFGIILTFTRRAVGKSRKTCQYHLVHLDWNFNSRYPEYIAEMSTTGRRRWGLHPWNFF